MKLSGFQNFLKEHDSHTVRVVLNEAPKNMIKITVRENVMYSN